MNLPLPLRTDALRQTRELYMIWKEGGDGGQHNKRRVTMYQSPDIKSALREQQRREERAIHLPGDTNKIGGRGEGRSLLAVNSLPGKSRKRLIRFGSGSGT